MSSSTRLKKKAFSGQAASDSEGSPEGVTLLHDRLKKKEKRTKNEFHRSTVAVRGKIIWFSFSRLITLFNDISMTFITTRNCSDFTRMANLFYFVGLQRLPGKRSRHRRCLYYNMRSRNSHASSSGISTVLSQCES